MRLIGVYAADLTGKIAGVLGQLGSGRAFVVHGSDGLDEITLTGTTRVSQLRNGQVSTSNISPADFGLQAADASALKGRVTPRPTRRFYATCWAARKELHATWC